MITLVRARWFKAGLLLLLCLGALSWAAAAAGAPAGDRRLLELPITIRMAVCQGAPVRPDSWVSRHVRKANKLLAPHRLRLVARLRPFTPKRCQLTSAAERSALAGHAPPGQITVLVVRRIQDLDLPGYDLMGVHWRYRGDQTSWQGRRWIYLTARADPPVLAHELAHYLGLPHDPAGGNLMTPGPSDPVWRRKRGRPAPYAPRLSEAQGRRLRRAARRVLAGQRGRAPQGPGSK